jgi:metabolite-proton symporter
MQTHTEIRTNRPGQVLFASLIGTTIEFFDFYIYATAAVLVFPQLFFPPGNPATARLASFATFGVAFVARPVGSAFFGHFGDRIGRKTTLVAALLTMGLSTVAISMLPTYTSLGLVAPLLLALCRFGQGVGLGGEWGGAMLLAVENAPPGKRSWYGMFPQLGAPLGFFLSTGVFLLLSHTLTETQFIEWGWRLPFAGSAALVLVGLYVRLTIEETPVFRAAAQRREHVRLPTLIVFRDHGRAIVAGVLASLTMFVVFYLLTVFTLSYGTTVLGYTREQFLLIQMIGVVCFAITIPIAAVAAEHGRRRTLMWSAAAIAVFGLVMPSLLPAGLSGAVLTLTIGLALMGFIYGPIGTVLSELFPTTVRYSGSSLTFNLAGIVGGALAPYLATWLAAHYGLTYVGLYLTMSAVLTMIGLAMMQETKDRVL